MLRILHNWAEVEGARKVLRERRCDFSGGWRRRLFQALFLVRYRSAPPPVAVNKSWDVLTMLDHVLERHPNLSTRIYDMGSFNSEIPLALWSTGYRHIEAVDLDPRGQSVNWYGNGIRFRRENFYDTSIAPETLDVITSLSTIEHGYDQTRLLATAQRLLKPGGTLCMTTDYHEHKLPVAPGFTLFGLPYLIFSRGEIMDLISAAEQFGFVPSGDLVWKESEYPIEWIGHRMTFVFLSLTKMRRPS